MNAYLVLADQTPAMDMNMMMDLKNTFNGGAHNHFHGRRACESVREQPGHRCSKSSQCENTEKVTAKACAHLAAGDRADPSRRRQRPCRVRRAATVDFLAPDGSVGTAALGPPLRADNSAQPVVKTDFDRGLQA